MKHLGFDKFSSATKTLTRCLVALVAICTLQPSASAKIVEARDTLTAANVFAELPISVLDILPRTSRLDMLDYADVDSLRPTLNNMGEISVLQYVDPTALDVKLTNVSGLKIRILPFKSEEIALTIYTVGRKEASADSQLNFFDSRMNMLPTEKFIKEPEIENFIIPKKEREQINGEVTEKDIMSRIPFMTVTYSMPPGSDILTAHLTIGKFIPKEDIEFVEPYLLKELKYRWNGKKFEPVRN